MVTIGLLYALKGCGQNNFWRWLTKDYRPLFLPLPCRTRLFRLLNSHRHYIKRFLADPSIIGVIDTYGIELIHPIRESSLGASEARAERSDKQIGKKGKSNKRWIVGGKLCFLLNHLGLIVSWDCNTDNVHDGSAFQLTFRRATEEQNMVDDVKDQMIVFSDTGFEKKDWHLTNLRICKLTFRRATEEQSGEWNVRMLIETVLLMNICL